MIKKWRKKLYGKEEKNRISALLINAITVSNDGQSLYLDSDDFDTNPFMLVEIHEEIMKDLEENGFSCEYDEDYRW